MATYKIKGGTPLFGSVRIGGAKNASYKLMLAALLGEKESRLLNFSRISDVETVAQIITMLGGVAKKTGERAMVINPVGLNSYKVPKEHGAQGRFSNMFIPVLLHKFKMAEVPLPGGDKIGKRPLERHFEGLEALGAKVSQTDQAIVVEAKELHGTNYTFSKNSHTGTETLIMAAVLAKGTTVLENAAEEPEIDDLIVFLNEMGAKISRPRSRVIEIQGVEKLGGAIHKLMPDRNEAVSYACAALATKGDVIIENAREDDLASFLQKLDEINAGYEVASYGIRFFYKGPLKATDVTTEIAPGFMTDWQPLWATLMTQAEGESTIHETIMDQRFQYVEALQKMGANISYFQPDVKDPDSVYNFNLEDSDPKTMHAIKIVGKTNLKAGSFPVLDLRHGATLILAAMVADGISYINNVEQVDRGYESLAERLQSMGADITRLEQNS